jgi:hypothetical protein
VRTIGVVASRYFVDVHCIIAAQLKPSLRLDYPLYPPNATSRPFRGVGKPMGCPLTKQGPHTVTFGIPANISRSLSTNHMMAFSVKRDEEIGLHTTDSTKYYG